MKGKRILSAVLSAALLLQLSPLAAFAEDTLPLSDTATTVQTEPAPEDLAIDAQIAPEPTAETPAEPTAEPTPEASEEPTATPTPEPTAEPTATPAAEESAPDAAETPAPEPSAEPTAAPDPAAAVQAMIDALPDEVTEDNAEAVEQALTDIDDAKESLTDDELAELNLTRYDAAANALLTLWGEAPADAVELLDTTYTAPGTDENGYYLITTESELRWFAQAVNGGKKSIKARLMNDITVSSSSTPWTPIGTYANRFKDTFDGNGHTISGLYCDKTNSIDHDYVGLFGYIDGGTVAHLGVIDSYFAGSGSVGGVCGYNKGTISGCYSTATVNSRMDSGGVLFGFSMGKVTNSFAYGTAQGRAKSFGGRNQRTVTNCFYPSETQGTSSGATAAKADEFKSGKVAYELGSQDPIWKQNLPSDPYPNFTAQSVGYASGAYHNHTDANTCIYCIRANNKPEQLTDGTYKITNEAQLRWFANEVNNFTPNSCALLMNDIIVDSTTPWTPIGKKANPFIGKFDGKGNTITGLYIDGTADYVGLFGCIGKTDTATGTVKDVILADSYVRGNENVGGICGWNKGGTIEQSTNQATVTGYKQVGGICGYNSGNITSCTAGGSVSTTSGDSVGGICGYNAEGTVKSCTSGCTVEGKGTSIGGICGYNWGGLLGCRNTGTVSGKRWVGGVCGDNSSSGNGIQGCYNEGAVFGTMSVGGVCGTNSGNLKKSYNTGNVSGNSYVGGVCGTNNENLQGCYNEGAVSGTRSVGGVCGTNKANLQECYNNGKVSGAESAVGGVCGYNEATVKGCYNTGDVSGTTQNVGGVCGYNDANVENCYYLAGTSEKAVGGEIGISTNCVSKTKLQFQNGAVAYLLQKAINDAADKAGTTAEQVWGQRIDTGTGETDDHPVLNGAYAVYPAAENSTCKRYSNTSGQTFNEHEYDEGTRVCSRCGESKPPEEVDGYYEIYNQGQLRWFANLINTTSSSETKLNARLMNDITMDGTEWTPIGTDEHPFTGTFDGNSKTITGLKCTDTSAYYVGLVGYASGAAIQNVTVQDAALNGNEYIGAVCGYITGGTITNCHVVNTAIGGNTEGKYYGGIVGCIIGNTNVTGCTNSGSTVNGGYHLGGIAGYAANTTVQCCFNSGAVTCKYAKSGGIVGLTFDATVQDCGNTGAVTKPDNNNSLYGGIVGEADSELTIQNCYNTDSNTAAKICGGIFYIPLNCYYLPNDTGSSGSIGTGITAKTAEQFASGEVAFLLQNKRAEPVWGQNIGTDDYPKLGGDKVYQSAPCTADYSNTEIPPKQHVIGNDGKCTDCGELCIAYTVTIPATVELGNKATITADGVILPDDKQLNVKVADDSKFEVALDGDTRAYTVTNVTNGETEVKPGGNPVLTVVNGVAESSVELQFNKPESTTYSGTYTGKVTFTVSVDN